MSDLPSLDRVLQCPSLPSLPAVAMRVLELTRKRDLSMRTLAETVQTDPALVARVLKTVNSSYYGLSQPCPSISRAMTLLGLNTVRSIVLGFSLLDFSKAADDGNGALDAYWRRALFGAAASKLIAKQIKGVDPEEAFVGALMRDMGMLACFATLKDEYRALVAACEHDHTALPGVEKEALGFDHSQVGVQLAAKWRLPDQLSACVAYHHQPELCRPEHATLVYCVGLGSHVATALSSEETKAYVATVAHLGERWLKLTRDHVRDLLTQTAAQAKDLATILNVKTGASVDIEQLKAEAQEQLVLGSAELERQATELVQRNEDLARQTVTDSLTQANNRSFFDRTLAEVFETCKQQGTPFAIAFFDADKFKSINDSLGHQAGDAVLKELSKRTRGVVGTSGHVCRYGGEEFAIILPNVDLAHATDLAGRLRREFDNSSFNLAAWNVPDAGSIRVTASIGVAWCDQAQAQQIAQGDAVTHAADECVYKAKEEGRNRVYARAVNAEPTLVEAGVGFTLQPKTSQVQAAQPAVAPTTPTLPAPAQPAPTQPTPAQPAATKPESTDPASTKPASTKPAPTKPASAKPALAKPIAATHAISSPAAATPAPQAASQTPAEQAPAPRSDAPGTILIIEDDPLAAKLLELLISKRTKHPHRIFESSEDLLASATGEDFSNACCILSDNQLPGIAGVNLVQVARVHPKLQHLPVVLMSSHVDQPLTDAAKRAGAACIIAKGDLCTGFDACFAEMLAGVSEMRAVLERQSSVAA